MYVFIFWGLAVLYQETMLMFSEWTAVAMSWIAWTKASFQNIRFYFFPVALHHICLSSIHFFSSFHLHLIATYCSFKKKTTSYREGSYINDYTILRMPCKESGVVLWSCRLQSQATYSSVFSWQMHRHIDALQARLSSFFLLDGFHLNICNFPATKRFPADRNFNKFLSPTIWALRMVII